MKEKEINSWLLVKKGQCSKDHAKEIFDIFFIENGKHLYNITKKQKLFIN